MKALLLFLLMSWFTLAGAEEMELGVMKIDELPEMCAGAYIMAGEEEKLILWKAMFSLRSDIVIRYFEYLTKSEDEDELPPALLKQAIDECDEIYRDAQSLHMHEPVSQATSQAPVVVEVV